VFSVATAVVMVSSPRTPVSSINKTDHHDIIEILLKVVLNTTTLTPWLFIFILDYCYLMLFVIYVKWWINGADSIEA
jgi:hypothetical protein